MTFWFTAWFISLQEDKRSGTFEVLLRLTVSNDNEPRNGTNEIRSRDFRWPLRLTANHRWATCMENTTLVAPS